MPRSHQRGNGVVTALLDFSFAEHVTLRLVRVLYLMVIGGAGAFGLLITYAGFARSFLFGVGALSAAAVLFFIAVVLGRVWLEATIAFFRIADNTAEIAEQAAVISVNTGKHDVQSAERVKV